MDLRAKVDEKLDELLAKNRCQTSQQNGCPLWLWSQKQIVILGFVWPWTEKKWHLILTIEEVLYHPNGSTVFSKLDLMCGFQQGKLEKKSLEITTLVTRLGRYKRVMFGVTSAP